MQVKLDLTVGSIRQAGYLAKVYPTSTSMQIAWVTNRFLSDFQKQSPWSFALSSEHIFRCTVHMFYDGDLCMGWLLILSPKVFGSPGCVDTIALIFLSTKCAHYQSHGWDEPACSTDARAKASRSRVDWELVHLLLFASPAEDVAK